MTYKHKFLTERAAGKGTVNCASGGPGRWEPWGMNRSFEEDQVRKSRSRGQGLKRSWCQLRTLPDRSKTVLHSWSLPKGLAGKFSGKLTSLLFNYLFRALLFFFECPCFSALYWFWYSSSHAIPISKGHYELVQNLKCLKKWKILCKYQALSLLNLQLCNASVRC